MNTVPLHDPVPRRIVAVFGGTVPDPVLDLAEEIGHELGSRCAILLTGGEGPGAQDPETVKNRAIRGAVAAQCHWIGVARTRNSDGYPKPQNGFQVESPLGHRRNYLEACLSDAAIVLMGDTGTQSELGSALALRRALVLVGERWHATYQGLLTARARTLQGLANATNHKFESAAEPALGYEPEALADALQQADLIPAVEWYPDTEAAAHIVEGALRLCQNHVALLGRFPTALDAGVSARLDAWIEALPPCR